MELHTANLSEQATLERFNRTQEGKHFFASLPASDLRRKPESVSYSLPRKNFQKTNTPQATFKKPLKPTDVGPHLNCVVTT